jgi:hypothetical protein
LRPAPFAPATLLGVAVVQGTILSHVTNRFP